MVGRWVGFASWFAVLGAGLVGAGLVGPGPARADEPVTLRQTWSGRVGFFATGAPIAVDGPDMDTTNADTLVQPASVTVGPPDVTATGNVRTAYLFWGGSINESGCFNPAAIDDTVGFTPPGGPLSMVVADACYCSDAAAGSYDVQACHANVTTLVDDLTGTYSVEGFSPLINNSSTSNASFSIVLVYEDAVLPPRRVALYDGLLTMSNAIDAEEILVLGGLDIDAPPTGDLTWYVLEGDVGGSAGESVQVTGMPGGGTLLLSDAYNPPDNPMNHTITTTTPPQTNLIGVDVDRFEIDGALSATDTSIEVRYTAGQDKWWLVYDVVSVNVFEPVLYDGSSKTWALHVDADGDGLPSPGDVIRYTLHLSNTGNADATVALSDPIPPQAASWTLVDAGGGVDASAAGTLTVTDLPLPVGATAEVVLDLVLDDVPTGTVMSNTAQYTAAPGGIHGSLVAPLVIVTNTGTSGSDDGSDSSDGSGGDTGDGTTGAADGSGGLADETGEGTGSGTSGGGSGGGDEAGSTGEAPPLGSTGPGEGDSGTTVPLGGGAEAEGCGCRSTSPGPVMQWLPLLVLGGGLRRSRARARSRAQPALSPRQRPRWPRPWPPRP